uniref:TIGR03986 family type III CRISPR-associated RAMP protein n=1 Tax=Mangrovimonas sp. TPBH4 TaxID=1645914 RepID=UPI0009E91FED
PWKFWRDNYLLKGKKVPVFYSKDKQNVLQHFGLAYMYKLPFNNSIHGMYPIADYQNSKLDLATCMFGYTERNEGLKGRLMFGHAKAKEVFECENEVQEILGGPKASYYPFYLNQFKDNRAEKYYTYQDKASLKGFKRYPVHSSGVKKTLNNSGLSISNKVYSSFKPLKEGTTFIEKIRFHNLKPLEIGGLLSAITFHGNQDKCCHSLGAAKPYGYGKVQVEIVDFNLEKSIDEYMMLFEEALEDKIPNWWQSPAIKELLAMASNSVDINLEYPSIKDFVDYKQTGNKWNKKPIDALDYYSTILDDKFSLKGFKSVKQLNKPQPQLELNFTRYQDLSSELNRVLKEEFLEFSEENKILIADAITNVYHSHKASQKKLNKAYDWENNINNWLGKELTEQLKESLNLPINV